MFLSGRGDPEDQGGTMSQLSTGRASVGAAKTMPTLDALVIACCLPAVLVVAAVIIIAGGFNPGFAIPAIVVGVMVGMLTYVSMRDRGRPEVPRLDL
jgi:multisubunit Na+/H+ antiporter MnhB subunit